MKPYPFVHKPDYYCRGKETRGKDIFICPHFEYCKRYSTSSYHKYFPRLPVSPTSSCRAFRKKEVILSTKDDILKAKKSSKGTKRASTRKKRKK